MKWLMAALATFLLVTAGSALAFEQPDSAKRLFPDSVTVTVATPLYSAFHQPGQKVRAILTHGAMMPDGTWLAPGTLISGRVLAASKADALTPGRLEVDFHKAFPPRSFPKKISAGFAAPGGILSADLQNMVLQRRGNGEFDALEAQIRSRGGTDPSVIRRFRKHRQKAAPGSGNRSREVILDAGDQVLIRFEPQ